MSNTDTFNAMAQHADVHTSGTAMADVVSRCTVPAQFKTVLAWITRGAGTVDFRVRRKRAYSTSTSEPSLIQLSGPTQAECQDPEDRVW